MLLTGGRIRTMDDRAPWAEALLVRDGRVAAVGNARAVAAERREDGEVIDLDGRVAIPGFVDGHCHLELTTTHLAYALKAFVAEHPTIADIVRAVDERAERTPPGEWIVGRADFGLSLHVADRRPLLRSDLDAATTDHPVVVFSGLHICTLNTRALEATGILDGSARLPRGSAVEVESGRAKELWDWLPLPAYTREQIAAAVRDVGRELFTSRGVTTIAELPFTNDGVHAFQLLRARGELPARLGLWFHVPRLGSIDDLLALGLETGFGDEWLQVGGIKLFVDGIGCDIDGNPQEDPKWSQAELDELVWRSHTARNQVWLHCAPTAASARMALTAIERAIAREPRPDHRHRIEHVGDLTPDRALLERIRAAGIIPVTTPQFTYSYGDVAPGEAATPLRTLHAMGLRPPGNSDCTGTQPEAANPWHSIWCAIAHRTRSGTPILPEEAIDVDDAVRTFTRDAAHACHLDDRGRLAPGLLGDVCVLDDDPFTRPVDDLPTMPVAMTIIGGRVMA
jgi:predicted amidohydrolase YtcJ